MRIPRLAGTAAVAAVLIVSATVSAGGFHAAQELRAAATGVNLFARDLAASGSDMAVVWEESAGPVSYIRSSIDAGATFAPLETLGTGKVRQPQVATCGGWTYAVAAQKTSNGWKAILAERNLHGAGAATSSLSTSGTASQPDVACVGTRRVATAWFQKSGSAASHVIVRVRPRAIGASVAVAPSYSFDLGVGTVSRGLSIAATNSAFYVAWMDGGKMRFARFTVAGDPDATVTLHPPKTLFTASAAKFPILAADGRKAALGYSLGLSAYLRPSGNSGVSFGAPFDSYVFGGQYQARYTSLAIRGTLYFADVLGESHSSSGTERRSWEMTTTTPNDGWVSDDSGPDGVRVGTLIKLAGHWKVVEAWDESLTTPDPQHLKFHRET
ncbi:MAG: hypothetical protein QOH68_3553 [Nocardioidaceae bacterium]|jgi:hypothetical protein|nr:hypothetical protein [Nocardioidaceae bacterium]MEA2623868.1 hypothetical protein [Chloroflexota bacterium]